MIASHPFQKRGVPLWPTVSPQSKPTHILSRKISAYLDSQQTSSPKGGGSISLYLLFPPEKRHLHLSVGLSSARPEQLPSCRHNLFDLLCKLEPSAERHLAVIPSASKVFMSEQIPYTFRQNSNFYYLCGFSEPDSVLVIHGTKGEKPKSVLFVPKHNQARELWDGPRTGPSGAVNLLKVCYLRV